MSMSVLVAEEEKLKRLKEYKEFKEILQKQLQDLQSEIKNMKSTLAPTKPKDEILNDPLKPHLKKRFLINDDDAAKKQAESLVQKLNRERKLKEQKKMKEIENMGKNLKGNIEQIKKERLEIEKQAKNEKNNNYLSRIHEVRAKKEFILKANVNPLELLNQYKNTSELNESLMRDKIRVSPDLLKNKKEELNKIRDLLKNK